MDQKDEQILQILKKNARLSTQQISNRTGIPITTVHNRIKRLEKTGIIKNFSVAIDYTKIGKGLMAFVMVRIDHKAVKRSGSPMKDLMIKIAKVPGVHKIYTVTGSIDMILMVRAKDIQELDKILTEDFMELDFIGDTETMIVTHNIS